jgi:hypothetical protein
MNSKPSYYNSFLEIPEHETWDGYDRRKTCHCKEVFKNLPVEVDVLCFILHLTYNEELISHH